LLWSFCWIHYTNKRQIFNRNLTSRNRLIKCIHPLSTHQWQLVGCVSSSTPAMTLHLFTLVGLLWCCCSFLGWESFSVPKNPTHPQLLPQVSYPFLQSRGTCLEWEGGFVRLSDRWVLVSVFLSLTPSLLSSDTLA